LHEEETFVFGVEERRWEMKCLDDCHTYDLPTFLGKDPTYRMTFYRMALDGTKTDGVTNEEIIRVLIHRIKYLNEEWLGGKFKCRENSLAITKLEEALMWLEKRTADREERNVEGTHNL